jgi:hypothetical protein
MVRSIALAKVYFTDVSDYKLRPILLCQRIAHDDYQTASMPHIRVLVSDKI